MKLTELESTSGFYVIDLVDPPAAVGVVRSARKILQGGAMEMARSVTYTYASLEREVAGASAGVNAEDEGRPEALAAFSAEVRPEIESGRLSFGPAKGVDRADLADLVAVDEHVAWGHGDEGDPLVPRLTAAGAAAAAGDLEDKSVVIEGFGSDGPALAAAVAAAGGRIVAISTAAGAALSEGFGAPDLATAWAQHGPAMVAALAGGDPEPGWKALAATANVLFVGSKIGVISHANAEQIGAETIVPHAPLPYTTKAMLMMEQAGKTVVPDFVALAGPAVVGIPEADSDAAALTSEVAASVAAVRAEVATGESTMFLNACLRAEAFLSTWQPELPFGRPLAP